MRLILSWLVLSFAVWVTDAVLPGFHLKNGKSALLIAAIFGLLNLCVGWIFWLVFGVATLGLHGCWRSSRAGSSMRSCS